VRHILEIFGFADNSLFVNPEEEAVWEVFNLISEYRSKTPCLGFENLLSYSGEGVCFVVSHERSIRDISKSCRSAFA
jgi:hypothetical protein